MQIICVDIWIGSPIFVEGPICLREPVLHGYIYIMENLTINGQEKAVQAHLMNEWQKMNKECNICLLLPYSGKETVLFTVYFLPEEL